MDFLKEYSAQAELNRAVKYDDYKYSNEPDNFFFDLTIFDDLELKTRDDYYSHFTPEQVRENYLLYLNKKTEKEERNKKEMERVRKQNEMALGIFNNFESVSKRKTN